MTDTELTPALVAKMKVAELRKHLEKLGENTKGLKAVLQKRLNSVLENQKMMAEMEGMAAMFPVPSPEAASSAPAPAVVEPAIAVKTEAAAPDSTTNGDAPQLTSSEVKTETVKTEPVKTEPALTVETKTETTDAGAPAASSSSSTSSKKRKKSRWGADVDDSSSVSSSVAPSPSPVVPKKVTRWAAELDMTKVTPAQALIDGHTPLEVGTKLAETAIFQMTGNTAFASNSVSDAALNISLGMTKYDDGRNKKEEATEINAETGEPVRKRRRRWGAADQKVDVPKELAAAATNMTAAQTESYLLKLQLQELEKKLINPMAYLPAADSGDRSPSPEPEYDAYGKRTNTRDVRFAKKLEMQRHKIIVKLMKLNPGFQPPAGYKAPRLEYRMYIPVDKYPQYNFIGQIIGPRGSTQKRLQEDSGCKIIIRGKGSVKESQRRPGQKLPGEDDELHVWISAPSEEALEKAKELTSPLLEPLDDDNEYKAIQLRELARMNGTLAHHNAMMIPKSKEGLYQITTAGEDFFIAQGGKQLAQRGQGAIGIDSLEGHGHGQMFKALDEEYESFMKELTGDAPVDTDAAKAKYLTAAGEEMNRPQEQQQQGGFGRKKTMADKEREFLGLGQAPAGPRVRKEDIGVYRGPQPGGHRQPPAFVRPGQQHTFHNIPPPNTGQTAFNSKSAPPKSSLGAGGSGPPRGASMWAPPTHGVPQQQKQQHRQPMMGGPGGSRGFGGGVRPGQFRPPPYQGGAPQQQGGYGFPPPPPHQGGYQMGYPPPPMPAASQYPPPPQYQQPPPANTPAPWQQQQRR